MAERQDLDNQVAELLTSMHALEALMLQARIRTEMIATEIRERDDHGS